MRETRETHRPRYITTIRSFHEVFSREVRRAHGEHHSLSALLLDVDDMQQINRELGRAAGDRLLEDVRGAVLAALRPGDVAALYGGDAVLMLLPRTSGEQGLRFAAHVEERLASLDGDSGAFDRAPTCSMGVATLQPGMSLADLVDAAADALACAKASGKRSIRGAAGTATTAGAPPLGLIGGP